MAIDHQPLDCQLPDLSGKSVLIMGGLGFIGSNLARACVERGAQTTVYDCLDPRSGGRLFNVEDIKDDIRLCFQDILNFDQLSSQIVKKEIIFNCAASTSHPFSMREPWIDLDVNGRGVINILEAIRRFNPEAKFVQLGTSTQLGKLQYQPADENHPEFPRDIYSANKSVAEKYVLIYANVYGLKGTVLRLSNVYGPRATIHSPDFTFNNYFIGQALRNRDITVYGDGGQIRTIIYVADVVNALLLMATTANNDGDTFFAVGDEQLSISKIAEKTVEIMGSGKVVYIDWPPGRKAADVGDAIISNRKIKERFGWRPAYSLDRGLAESREFYINHLEKYCG